MTKTFRTFPSRLDQSLACFASDNNASLRSAICTNSATGYVWQKKPEGAVMVPKHVASDIVRHLLKLGWRPAA